MAWRPSIVLFALLGIVTGGLLATPPIASAQLSAPSLNNSSNGNETVAGSASAASRERLSSLSQISSPAGAFTTQYTSLISTDSDGGGAGSGVESIGSDYQIDFTATAPGAYTLTITTSISGDMHLVNDGTSASADIGTISGTQSGGSVVTGSLDIADPGGISGSGGIDAPFSDGSSATVFGISNGAPIAHNLHFVFTQIVTSAATGGDEAAIRLGQASTIGTETAGKPVVGANTWLLSPCGVLRSPISRGGLLHVGYTNASSFRASIVFRTAARTCSRYAASP